MGRHKGLEPLDRAVRLQATQGLGKLQMQLLLASARWIHAQAGRRRGSSLAIHSKREGRMESHTKGLCESGQLSRHTHSFSLPSRLAATLVVSPTCQIGSPVIFTDTPFSRMRENVKNIQFLTGPRSGAMPVGRCKQK